MIRLSLIRYILKESLCKQTAEHLLFGLHGWLDPPTWCRRCHLWMKTRGCDFERKFVAFSMPKVILTFLVQSNMRSTNFKFGLWSIAMLHRNKAIVEVHNEAQIMQNSTTNRIWIKKIWSKQSTCRTLFFSNQEVNPLNQTCINTKYMEKQHGPFTVCIFHEINTKKCFMT